MNKGTTLLNDHKDSEFCWLVTGGAGFIGSHIVEYLISCGQKVRVLDNFSTGFRSNLPTVSQMGREKTDRLEIIKGDIRDTEVCLQATKAVDIVLHQAALGSVPKSVKHPATSNSVNIDGFLNVLLAAKQNGVKRFVFASSSSVYGDSISSPKREEDVGTPLSPYAVTKRANELYAEAFSNTYGIEAVGLRYFNVFGPRQDPNGSYAAVIPSWIDSLLNNKPCTIYGDGQTTRDFCYVGNVVQANIRAALAPFQGPMMYNIACQESVSLNDLFETICNLLTEYTDRFDFLPPKYSDFRPGDIRHSLADISKARRHLGYEPTESLSSGLEKYISWWVNQLSGSATDELPTEARQVAAA